MRENTKNIHSQIIHYSFANTSLGPILLAASKKGICWIHFGEEEASLVQALQSQFSRNEISQADQTTQAQLYTWIQEIEAYLQGTGHLDSLPIDIHGTDFQVQVWQQLRKIPYGELITYQKLAKMMGSVKLVRAVAKACSTNHIALIIPCHRVVKSDGKLAGYRWGLERKAKLLELENKSSSIYPIQQSLF